MPVLTFKLALAADRVTPVGGLVMADFLITSDGAKITPTAVTETAVEGTYTATITAVGTGKKVVVSTYDDTTKTLAILSDGILFRGVSNVVTSA